MTQIRYLKNLKILNFILLKEMILIMKKIAEAILKKVFDWKTDGSNAW